MAQVIDFSGRAPSHYPAGIIGAVRYIAPRHADGTRRPKCITEAELAAHRAAGRQVGFVFEDSALNTSGGAAQGDKDGKRAAAEMIVLDVPAHAGVAVYAAVDHDVSGADLPTVAAYLDAFHRHITAAGYRRGVYGEFDVVVTMLHDGHVDFGWQTVAWSGRRHAAGPGVVLFQTGQQIAIDGTSCDVNDVLAADWGQWGLSTPVPAPAATSQQEDLLMSAAHDDNDARRALVRFWCLTFWGAEPTLDEQNILTYSFGLPPTQGGGADLTLAHIADHDKAKAFRAAHS